MRDPVIAATSIAVPPCVVTLDAVKASMRDVFDIEERRLDVMMAVADHARIHKRHAIFPLEYTVQPRPLSQLSREYQEHSVRLGCRVAKACLANAGMTAHEIDMIITVSCTGFMIPSLDAHLINLMGFRANVRRLPLTELGCAAGAMALSRAREFVLACPGASVLIVCVELPSLTFQVTDLSQANLISSVLFGDGAAAAVVTGSEADGPGIVDVDTYTFPGSLDAMGFDLRDDGFHIVLSKDVPQMIAESIRERVDGFLARSGIGRRDVSAFLLHPGGQKLLSYIEQELGLRPSDTQVSWDVLREYGNLSSATILFILDAVLAGGRVRAGGVGLAAAFGPGFSAEFLLLKWPERPTPAPPGPG